MSADPSSNDLPPDGRSAEHLPYGVDTIVIPFTRSAPQWRRLPVRGFGGYEWVKGPYPPDHVGQGYDVWERQLASGLKDARLTSTELVLSALQSLRQDFPSFRPHNVGTAAAAVAGNANLDGGASNGATVPDQAAALASSPPPGASPPIGASAAATAEVGTAAGAAAANVDRLKDPTAPVPVVDDQGKPVLIPDGPFKGQQMLRPAGLDPHFFVNQGIADKSRYDALLHTANPYGGNDAGPAWVLREFMQMRKFRQGGEWDAQRVGGRYHAEYVDYATVAIGLYAASLGMSRDLILRVQALYAMLNSKFDPEAKRDETYTHLPHRNVANTDLGYQLYQSGQIRAASGP